MLVPEENSEQAVPAITQGWVGRRLVLLGTQFHPDTLIVELTNPEAGQAALGAEWQVKAAQAQYNSLKAQLDSQLLDQKATAAIVKSDYLQTKLQTEKDAGHRRTLSSVMPSNATYTSSDHECDLATKPRWQMIARRL